MVREKQEESAPAAVAVGPVKVDSVGPPKPPGELYWIGVISNRAAHSVTVAGISFPFQTEDVQHNRETGETVRIPKRGAIVRLTTEQIEAIRRNVVQKWLRRRGNAAVVVSQETPGFAADPENDVPLARSLYCIPVGGLGEGIRSTEPIPMMEG